MLPSMPRGHDERQLIPLQNLADKCRICDLPLDEAEVNVERVLMISKSLLRKLVQPVETAVDFGKTGDGVVIVLQQTYHYRV